MIPDYCAALTAYRCWNVHGNGLLAGQAHNDPWPPYQPMVARCGSMVHAGAHLADGVFLPAPVLRCGCGIYGLKTAAAMETRLLDHVRSSLFGFPIVWTGGDPVTANAVVWGAVQLWGRLIEHEIGYRAECAYPSALWCEDERLAATVAALYGVPCAVRRLPRPEPEYLGIDEAARFFNVPQRLIVTGPGLKFGASRFQQQHDAAKQAADRRAIVDWRELFKKAFHAPAQSKISGTGS